MKPSELKKLFKKTGTKLVKHGKKHDLYYCPVTKETFTVPRHKRDIAKGTLDSILESAGLKK